MEPEIVVTLVHGTFAKDTPWLKPDSPICKSFVDAFPGRIYIEPFGWSGANNFYSRLDAAVELREHIKKLQGAHPKAFQFVVAHSHGGNVAIRALRLLAPCHRVLGIACLATPFIHVKPRDLALFTGRDIQTAFSGLFLVCAMLSSLFLHLSWAWNLIVEFLAILGGNLLGAILGGIQGGAVHAFRSTFEDFAKDSSIMPSGIDLFIVRGTGDEASLALGVGQFLSSLSARIYSLLAISQRRDHFIKIRRNPFPQWLLYPWIAFSILFVTTAIILGLLRADTPETIFFEVSSLFFVPLFFLTVVVATTAFDFTLFGLSLFGCTISACLAALWFGTGIPKRQEDPPPKYFRWIAWLLIPIMLEVNTEVTPVGTWIVTQLDRDPGFTPQVASAMVHEIHSDPRTSKLLCDWIKRLIADSRVSNSPS